MKTSSRFLIIALFLRDFLFLRDPLQYEMLFQGRGRTCGAILPQQAYDSRRRDKRENGDGGERGTLKTNLCPLQWPRNREHSRGHAS